MNDSLLKQISYLFPVICLIIFPGCAEERPHIPHPSVEYVVIVDVNGKPDNILLEQFFKKKDQHEGAKVLVIDKKSKSQKLITPADLFKQNPNAGPYLIFKHDDPQRPFDDLPR